MEFPTSRVSRLPSACSEIKKSKKKTGLLACLCFLMIKFVYLIIAAAAAAAAGDGDDDDDGDDATVIRTQLLQPLSTD